MGKIDLRQRICARKFAGHTIVPKVELLLNARTKEMRTMKMRMVRSSSILAEVCAKDKHGTERRYTVNTKSKTCSCRTWQITGLPCHHALYFILKLGDAAAVENFVHSYFSVDKFAATYAENVPPMADPTDWETVDPGFKLEPPVRRRPPGRPRKLGEKNMTAKKGSKLGARNRKCKRCGGLGHIKRLCKNPVPHDFEEHNPREGGGEASFDEVEASKAEGQATRAEGGASQAEDEAFPSEKRSKGKEELKGKKSSTAEVDAVAEEQEVDEELDEVQRDDENNVGQELQADGEQIQKQKRGEKCTRKEKENNGGGDDYENATGMIEDVLKAIANSDRNSTSNDEELGEVPPGDDELGKGHHVEEEMEVPENNVGQDLQTEGEKIQKRKRKRTCRREKKGNNGGGLEELSADRRKNKKAVPISSSYASPDESTGLKTTRRSTRKRAQ